MYKYLWSVLLLSTISLPLLSQKISGHPRFSQGKTLTIRAEIKNTIAQQAGGQAIDFSVNGMVAHAYTVTNTTDETTTLHHKLQRLSFEFDGMGQEKSFDSDNPKDRQGPLGKQFDEILGKQYDIIIDSSGKTLMTIPEKIELSKEDERMVIITNMLKDLTNTVYPPKKGNASFFSVLPAREISVGDSWTETVDTDTEQSTTINTLAAITDSVITVTFKTKATLVIHSQMMGVEAKTNLENMTTGFILLDKATGIIREKSSTTDSNGSTEAMGTLMPITGKTTTRITVQQN